MTDYDPDAQLAYEAQEADGVASEISLSRISMQRGMGLGELHLGLSERRFRAREFLSRSVLSTSRISMMTSSRLSFYLESLR